VWRFVAWGHDSVCFHNHETLAKPLAQALMAEGPDVWFDEWEIRTGDSLRRCASSPRA